MFFRLFLVNVIISVLNQAHALQFNYDAIGCLTNVAENSHEIADKSLFYQYDASSNLLSVSNDNTHGYFKDAKLSLDFDATQNYNDVVINFNVEDYHLDLMYDIYLSEDTSPLLYKSVAESGSIALNLSSNTSPLFVQIVATNKFGQKLFSKVKKLLPLDSDKDQLPDHVEQSACSDPNNADSDGDGLSDGIEMGIETGRYLSNPCNQDSDNDGIGDRWEYDFGSDLLVSDVGNQYRNGMTYWQAYTAAQSKAAQDAGISIKSGDHVLDLEGVKGFVRTGIFPEGEQPMTVMFWTRLKGLTDDNQLLGVHDATHSKRFYVGIDKENDAMFGVGNNYTDQYDSGIEFGEWAHIALVYDPVNKKTHMFRNGQSVVWYNALKLDGRTSQSLLLGARINGQAIDSYMDGQLDDIQVWTRALTEREIQTYMLSTPQQGEKNLIALYNFSDIRGDWVKNIATGEFDAQLSSADLIQQAEQEADRDNDGLTDRQELALCTDINNADSDGDGLSDGIEMGIEIGRYLSNPCNSDTDGDGIDDAYEYAKGWDIRHFDITAVNEQGVNRWTEYVQAQTALAQEKGESIVSGEHLLDVTNKNAFGYTGFVPSGEHSMTLMYWVNFNTLGSHYQFSGVHDDNNHRLYAGLDYGRPIAGVGNSNSTGSDKVGVNQWVHLAAVFDTEARQRVLYLNGRELKRDSYVSFKGASLRSLLFGAAHRLQGASDFQDAKLDDIQVWSRALDGSDVQSYMLTPPKPGELELLGYYDFGRYRGLWVENVATGEFDMKLSEINIIKNKE